MANSGVEGVPDVMFDDLISAEPPIYSEPFCSPIVSKGCESFFKKCTRGATRKGEVC